MKAMHRYESDPESNYDPAAAPGKEVDDADLVTESKEELITLRELAARIGVPQQDIVNLIIRFDLLSPQKSAAHAPRETYVFTREEATLVRQIFELRDMRGKPMREAVEIVRNYQIYDEAAHKLRDGLIQYAGNSESRSGLILSILQSPLFSDLERRIITLIELQGKSILEAGAELGMKSESEVKRALELAKEKFGIVFLQCLIALRK
jgi:hypothetical protein